MRAVRITLYTQLPIALPLAYNELVQGLLYGCWRERWPEMHDEGFGGARAFRPFTFGRLEGPCRADGGRRTIEFASTVTLEVRSPVEELMDELCLRLSQRGEVRIGSHVLRLVNLMTADRLLFPERAVARMRAPVVAYERRADGHTTYRAPGDDGWLGLVRRAAARKAEALGLGPDVAGSLQAIPLSETLRKQVTQFKGTWVTGWLGDVVVSGDPQLMAALWCLGLGAKGSQGFGMFDFEDRPL